MLMFEPTVIWSDDTVHTATLRGGGWELSWLPGYSLQPEQAFAGMQLAMICAHGHDDNAAPWIETLADQIGIPADAAEITLHRGRLS